MTLTDTGPLVAIVDTGDPDHARCRTALASLTPPLLTSWSCFTEALYLLRREGGYPFVDALWRLWEQGLLVLHSLTAAESARVRELMATYRDTPMDLADATLVVAAERLGLRRVFTLDRHFYAYRMADGSALGVVP